MFEVFKGTSMKYTSMDKMEPLEIGTIYNNPRSSENSGIK